MRCVQNAFLQVQKSISFSVMCSNIDFSQLSCNRLLFIRAMRRYLCQIFSMSLSSLPCPLEFFIASVVGQVPLPVAGGRPFHVVQDAALISSTSCSMNAIEFEVPLPR